MSAKIVSFAERRGQVKSHSALLQAEAYWDGLRNGRPAPSRAEVDPRGLSGILPNSFILERIAPGLARFRVAGQHLSDVMGLDLRGLPLSLMFLPEARPQLEDSLERVFSVPEITRLSVSSPASFKACRIEGQMLLLPLRSDLGAMTRALGCLSMDGITGPRPRRLGIDATQQRVIPDGEPCVVTPGTTERRVQPDQPAQVIDLPLPAD